MQQKQLPVKQELRLSICLWSERSQKICRISYNLNVPQGDTVLIEHKFKSKGSLHGAAQTSRLTQDRMRHYFPLRNTPVLSQESQQQCILSTSLTSQRFICLPPRQRCRHRVPERRRERRRINNRLRTGRQDSTVEITKHLVNRTMMLINMQLNELKLSGSRFMSDFSRYTFISVKIIHTNVGFEDSILMCYRPQ